jgi:hypothetical protein
MKTPQERVLETIQLQTGLELQLDEHLPGVRKHNKRTYFNVALRDRIWDSQEYNILERFVKQYPHLMAIEPNGLRRVAIYFWEWWDV